MYLVRKIIVLLSLLVYDYYCISTCIIIVHSFEDWGLGWKIPEYSMYVSYILDLEMRDQTQHRLTVEMGMGSITMLTSPTLHTSLMYILTVIYPDWNSIVEFH